MHVEQRREFTDRQLLTVLVESREHVERAGHGVDGALIAHGATLLRIMRGGRRRQAGRQWLAAAAASAVSMVGVSASSAFV